MSHKKKYPTTKIFSMLFLSAVFGLGLLAACQISLPGGANPTQPEAISSQRLFEGITYSRQVRNSPRPIVIHIIFIKLNAPGIKFLVTPPRDADLELPLEARTTSKFVKSFEVQLAVNGDGFDPWYSLGILGYSPKTGEMVAPSGLAVSNGEQYSEALLGAPVLNLGNGNNASINLSVDRYYNAISGSAFLVSGGEVLPALAGSRPQPRTAVGLRRVGNQLILVVVDGRQDGYSEGMSLAELAELFVELDAVTAMALDGGGSTALVIQGEDGEPKLLNSPIHQGIPGNERPVGNHLGIFANK